MELFDASGVAEPSGAQALSDALAALAKPLEEISKNTAETAKAATKDIKPNPDFESAMGFGPNTSVTTKAATKNMRSNPDLEAAFGFGPTTPDLLAKTEAQRNAAKAMADQLAALKKQKAGDFLVQSKTASLPVAQNVTNLPTAQRLANVTSATQAAPSGMAAAMQGLQSLGSQFAAVGASLGPLVIAAGGAAAALTGVVAASLKATEAFDPYLVDQFNLAVRDLTAVFGSVLYPVVQQSTRVVKLFADTIFASGSELTASVKTIAKAVGDVFVALLPVVSKLTQGFAWMLSQTASLVDLYAGALVPVIRSFSAVVAGVSASLSAVFGGLTGTSATLKDVMVKFGQAMGRALTVIAALAFKVLGMTAALTGMMNSLAPGGDAATRQNTAGLAAAQNARMSSVADVGRDVLQKAFMATGRAGEMEAEIGDQEFRSQLLDDVRYIAEFKWKDQFKQLLIEVATEIAFGPITATRKLAEETVRQVTGDGPDGRNWVQRANSTLTFGIL